jgi:hypothetical protein
MMKMTKAKMDKDRSFASDYVRLTFILFLFHIHCVLAFRGFSLFIGRHWSSDRIIIMEITDKRRCIVWKINEIRDDFETHVWHSDLVKVG